MSSTKTEEFAQVMSIIDTILIEPGSVSFIDADCKKSGLDTYALLNAAGCAVAATSLKAYPQALRFVVLAGPGNNGGDGYVAARALLESGATVEFTGVTEDKKSEIFLRPETAQGIFINFSNVQRSMRKKVPFGIAQIGKSFRNEITPGNFTFRTREFEQMELEFFCKPGTDAEWFEFWKNFCENWLLSLGMSKENIRIRDHEKEELCHYSSATSDIEYLFPFGWGELWGIADRTDFDLKQHQKFSGKTVDYFDSETNERYIPYVIEPSLGADRVALAFLCDAYTEEEIEGEKRTVMKLHPALAPFKACVLPLSKKLSEKAKEVKKELSKCFMVDYDEAGSIGKRYRRQDEIGTPICITYDFESEEDGCVTVRDRDTMKQERIKIELLKDYISKKIEF